MSKVPPRKARWNGAGTLRSENGEPPLTEYDEVALQHCLRCGKEPSQEMKGGFVVGLRTENGELVADTICLACMDDAELVEFEKIMGRET